MSPTHTVKLHGVVVGWSDLEHADPDLGRAHGRFRPGLGYPLVEPVFRLFAEAVPREGARDEQKLARYHRSRDALALELFDAAGRRIPTSAIHIADYTADPGAETCELDVLITDDDYWRRRALVN
ncbi:MAG TPA: hypothetical protein VJU87_00375 [Gemmatimonadaceae bacterium]|nr:hypothetical protein [Gemmatimonadaceae bacterium]